MSILSFLIFMILFWQHLWCETAITVVFSHCTSQGPANSQSEVGGSVTFIVAHFIYYLFLDFMIICLSYMYPVSKSIYLLFQAPSVR